MNVPQASLYNLLPRQSILLTLIIVLFFYLKKIFIYFSFGRGEGKETEGEKHQCVVSSHVPLYWGPGSHPGMCPDWDLNWQPFGLQAHAQSTELHQPGPFFYFVKILFI